MRGPTLDGLSRATVRDLTRGKRACKDASVNELSHPA